MASVLRALLAGSLASAASGVSVRQPLRSFTEINDPATYEAYAWQPTTRAGPFPLLLYLHSAEQRGGSLFETLNAAAEGSPIVGIHRNTALPQLYENFVVVGPHSNSAWDTQSVLKFLDFLLSPASGLNIDSDHLYVSGFADGGLAAMEAAQTMRFAAVVPVATNPPPSAKPYKDVNMWVFHARNDVVSNYTAMEHFVNVLYHDLEVHPDDVHLTLFDTAPATGGSPGEIGHASSIPAYATPVLYHWMLGYSVSRAEHSDA